ncbi:MAG: hypothetical protein ACR2P1_16420 [Pseudomonadales bacterium]
MLTLFNAAPSFLVLRYFTARSRLLLSLRNKPRHLRHASFRYGAVGVALLCHAAHSAKADEYETIQLIKYADSTYTYKSYCESDIEALGCTDENCDLLAGQGKEEDGWMDTSHEFVTTQADALAGWMDGFFGTRRANEEAARSFLRLRFQHEWDEDEGHDIKTPRLSGKVKLPLLDKRLDLVFADELGENDSVNEEADQLLDNNQPDSDIALQYTGVDSDRSRLSFTVSPNRKLKLKARMRYRYKYPFSEKYSGRFTEELLFRDGEGFSTTTRLELDDVLNENLLLRWSNRFRYGEETDGVEWNSTIGLGQRIDDKHAISYFASISGKTKPEFISEREANRLPGEPRSTNEKPGWLTEAYGLGVLYRVNFFRRWLFVEIEPAVLWRRRFEREYKRKPVGVLTARLEIMFDKEHSKK